MNSLLSVKNLSKTYYDVKAIDDISFDVNEGEFLSLIGPSGCGKSTILNILALIDKDYDGIVSYMDEVTIGYMSQDNGLFPYLSVWDNAILGLKVKKKINKDSLNYTKSLLKKYGLYDFRNKKTSSLSGGMKQRLSLIRTLAIKPKLILLDEAFSALDYVNRIKVSEDVYNIIKSEGVTVLMVTHDISEAISLSDRIIVLSDRPSKVKSVYNISILESSPSLRRVSSLFNHYFDNIWKDINNYE